LDRLRQMELYEFAAALSTKDVSWIPQGLMRAPHRNLIARNMNPCSKSDFVNKLLRLAAENLNIPDDNSAELLNEHLSVLEGERISIGFLLSRSFEKEFLDSSLQLWNKANQVSSPLSRAFNSVSRIVLSDKRSASPLARGKSDLLEYVIKRLESLLPVRYQIGSEDRPGREYF